MVRLLLTTALVAGSFLWSGAAIAQCAPVPPTTGATVTCTGTDPDGFLFGGNGGVDDVTLTVESAATVTNGANARGIDLRDGADITVEGTVSTTNADAIRVRNDGTLFVSGSITATGADGDGIQAGNGLDLDLFGTITAGKDGVNAGDDADVFLGSSAEITATDDGLQLGDDATVSTNAGSLIDSDDEAITAGNGGQFILRGTIEGLDDAVQVGESVNITNLGRIANVQTQAMIDSGEEAQDGVDLDSGFITNGGFINSTAEISSTFGDAIDFDESDNPLDSVIDNFGLIQGGNRAVETDPANDKGQWVINRASGRILAGNSVALNLGAGADRYDHFAGATLDGGIDFGAGDDILQILGAPTGPLGGPGALMDGGAGDDSVFFTDYLFDQLSGTINGAILDLRFGTGPDLFSLRLTGFETFFFADEESYTLGEVAGQLEVVPLPAPALLLLGGLGALGLMRRRTAA